MLKDSQALVNEDSRTGADVEEAVDVRYIFTQFLNNEFLCSMTGVC